MQRAAVDRRHARASLPAVTVLIATSLVAGDAAAQATPVGHFPDQNPPPRGASALCNDGTYALLANNPRRDGTCAHNGGVKVWLTAAPPR